jgi:hypothetical protein
MRKRAVNGSLYAFNIAILFLGILYAHITRNVKAGLTETSQAIALFLTFYSFMIRLPAFLDPDAAGTDNLDFLYITTIMSLGLCNLYATGGSLFLAIYYELKGQKYLRNLLKSTKIRLKKVTGKMSAFKKNNSASFLYSPEHESNMRELRQSKKSVLKYDLMQTDSNQLSQNNIPVPCIQMDKNAPVLISNVFFVSKFVSRTLNSN